MGVSVRSKKMAGFAHSATRQTAGLLRAKMVRIGAMASPKSLLKSPLDRRELLAGLGAAAMTPIWPTTGSAQGRTALALQAKAGQFSPQTQKPVEVWSLAAPEVRLRRGDTLDIAFVNDLPVPALPAFRGLGGIPAAEPLLARPAVAAGGRETLQLPLRYAGTAFCDLGLLGDGLARPSRGLPLIVHESEPVAVDRDQVFLIEEWRMRPDGTLVAPGTDPKDTEAFHTVNGVTPTDLAAIPLRTNERLRFRFINASHRSAVAVKLEDLEVRVMAIDGQPAEPFPARNGAVVLAPGSRADAFIDVAGPAGKRCNMLLHDGKQAHLIRQWVISSDPPIRPAALPPAPPLPSNGLPAQLELKNAQRIDLALGGPQTDWVSPGSFTASAPPAFAAKTGRTVVLALANRADRATVFHLHGHHFRLLDRLDDGWKPFWLDTLAIEPGQTARIAFAAEHAGRFLLESVATDWWAPRLVRFYSVG
jgi:FtsP/CotA-like multicopper oxidase with cupredoxin domain